MAPRTVETIAVAAAPQQLTRGKREALRKPKASAVTIAVYAVAVVAVALVVFALAALSR